MAASTEAIRTYLAKLGLDPEIADIYLALHAYGPQNISVLSRKSGVERTRIYRLLDLMKEANLVEVEVHDKRSIVKAAHIGNLQSVLSKREQELRSLQDELREIEQHFTASSISSDLTKVHFYQGLDGNKQMFWNQTRAVGETVCILYENMQNKTNSAYFERWVRKCNERGLKFRGIIGEHFIKTQQDWYATHQNERLEHWESRYLDPTTYPITHSVVVYDNVVAYYNWKDGEIFGIEMINQEIADAQRRVFEMLWDKAKPVDDLKGLIEAAIA
ncbi:MAG TPA: helix-turn-helix domain-containing protein [Candidatus Saccharimonadales bacterium]|nr:helix-turn-helix domain-containing protein [Candidatus Saccharimonadales bacterium]